MLTLCHCLCQLLLYHTGEGNDARCARQPKLIDFGGGSDGETRTLARRLEVHFPDILAREELVHLCQGVLNGSVRGRVLRSLLHNELLGALFEAGGLLSCGHEAA